MKKLNLSIIILLPCFLVMTENAPANDADSQQMKAWNESRCSEFLNLDSPEALFLSKKCGTKKGRWLRKCINNYNDSGAFDRVLSNFQVFHNWKCYPAISTYFANKSQKPTPELRSQANNEEAAQSSESENDLPKPAVESVSPPAKNIKESTISDSDRLSKEDKIETLYQVIKHLQQRVSDLETEMRALKR